MIHTEARTKERILLMGPPGTGKSTAWLKIAQMHQTTGNPAQFWVGDTDMAVDRMLDTEYPTLSNIHLYPLYDWPDYMMFLAEARKHAGPDDWVVVDLLDPAWEAVQSYYIQQVFGEDTDSFFLEHRKNMKDNDRSGALDGWKDWGVINKLYKGFANKLAFSLNCHILCTTKVDKVNTATDSKENRVLFDAFGVKPKGQKETAHAYHTVLLMTMLKPGDWYINTVKDRGRTILSGVQMKNFATEYLVKVGNWKLR